MNGEGGIGLKGWLHGGEGPCKGVGPAAIRMLSDSQGIASESNTYRLTNGLVGEEQGRSVHRCTTAHLHPIACVEWILRMDVTLTSAEYISLQKDSGQVFGRPSRTSPRVEQQTIGVLP